MKKYSCLNCTNNGSPLCEYCSTVISPGGKEQKPSYFVPFSHVMVSGGLGFDIVKRIFKQQSVPISLVLKYNEKIAPSEEEVE